MGQGKLWDQVVEEDKAQLPSGIKRVLIPRILIPSPKDQLGLRPPE